MSRVEWIVARTEERLRVICEAVPPLDPPPAFWLDSDAGPSYCRRCVRTARGAEFELGAPLTDTRSYHRTNAEDAFWEGVDGGFDTTSDSTAACDICGRTLSYILTDYGIEQEIDYYRDAPLVVVRDEDSYALDRLCLNLWSGSPRAVALGCAIAVNQAYRIVSASSPSSEQGRE